MRAFFLKWTQIKLRWKLTIVSASLFFLLFIAYNVAQLQFMENWVSNLETDSLTRTAHDVETLIKSQNDWGDQSVQTLTYNLNQIRSEDELIKVYDQKGRLLTQVSNGLPSNWIQLSKGKSDQMSDLEIASRHIMMIQKTINAENISGTLLIAKDMSVYDNLLKVLKLFMLIGCLGAALLSVFIGVLLSYQLLKPIGQLKKTIQKVQEGGFKERVIVPEHQDELTTLSRMFNDMMEKVDTTFSTQKQFIEDASHELRTPIAILEGHLSLIDRWGKNDKDILDESVAASLHEVDRLKTLVNDLLNLSKFEAQHSHNLNDLPTVDIAPLLVRLVQNFRLLHPSFEILINMDEDQVYRTKINAFHFEQLVAILLDNAIKYSTTRKEIICTLSHSSHTSLSLSIRDFGMGIPKQEMSAIFDRFYRVDKTRSRDLGGNGLGLSIAKQWVDFYKGKIEMESEEDQGTTATITFNRTN